MAGLITAVTLIHSRITAWPWALLAIVTTGYFGALATRNCKIAFPKELGTVADLSRWVMMNKGDLALPQTSSWTRDQIAARVREIVVQILSCESTYREDARFIEDLGLG
jgi:hypothetical protein